MWSKSTIKTTSQHKKQSAGVGQNSHVNTYVETHFNKIAAFRSAIILKKDFSRGIPVSFDKFLRTFIL